MKLYPQDTQMLVEMYESGMTYEEIALEVGSQRRTVELKIKAAGGQTRPRGGIPGKPNKVDGKAKDGLKGKKAAPIRNVRSRFGRARARKGRYA